MKDLYYLSTNDVETTSILNHKLRDKTGEYVLKEGMPLLLDLYEKYNVKATFFFTGYMAEKFPDVVKMVIPCGHEIGSHGYSHKVEHAFDIMSFNEQVEHLTRSKYILESISDQKIISFRAPAARVNKETPSALIKTGFKIDSSVSSQRFDMFLSFGGIKKLNWLTSPRLPYFTSPDNLWKSGNSPIFEIPISALLIPYIGTTLRIIPGLTRLTRNMLHYESTSNGKPVVFLTHPNEFIDEEREEKKTIRRGKNVVSYVLGDIVRRKLKLKNLGKKAIPLLERELDFFSEKGYRFITCSDYLNTISHPSN